MRCLLPVEGPVEELAPCPVDILTVAPALNNLHTGPTCHSKFRALVREIRQGPADIVRDPVVVLLMSLDLVSGPQSMTPVTVVTTVLSRQLRPRAVDSPQRDPDKRLPLRGRRQDRKSTSRSAL